jgi:hypothetical protein
MWIFSQYGFYSVVTGRDFGTIQLRTRDREHLEKLIVAIPSLVESGYKIVYTKDADYQYRLIISKEEWANIVLPKLGDIDYGNFKNQAEKKLGRGKYVDFLHRLWGAVYDCFDRRSVGSGEKV